MSKKSACGAKRSKGLTKFTFAETKKTLSRTKENTKKSKLTDISVFFNEIPFKKYSKNIRREAPIFFERFFERQI